MRFGSALGHIFMQLHVPPSAFIAAPRCTPWWVQDLGIPWGILRPQSHPERALVSQLVFQVVPHSVCVPA